MGAYNGADLFPASIYQFEETDVVQGGPDGIDNKPLQELADRTVYLRKRIGLIANLSGDRVISSSASVTNADAGKLIVATAPSAGTTIVTLAAASTFVAGTILPISSFCLGSSGVVRIAKTGSDFFYDTDGNKSELYMHHKEHLFLVVCSGHFKILNASSGLYTAGEEIKGRKAVANTAIPQGQLLSRALYPRLWAFVQTLTMGQEVTTEANWLSGAFGDPLRYRGLYTTGDGSTNFRLPDERAMHDRMLDMGRGIDISRPHNYPGGYSADAVKNHTHPYVDRYYPEAAFSASWFETMPAGYNGGLGSGDSDTDNVRWLIYNATTSQNTGGTTENLVKTIGKYNLIRY